MESGCLFYLWLCLLSSDKLIGCVNHLIMCSLLTIAFDFSTADFDLSLHVGNKFFLVK